MTGDRDYCTIHLCQRRYCRRRHGLGKPPANGPRPIRPRSPRSKIPKGERRRLAQFIRQNRDAPIQKSGVGYFLVETSHGKIEMTPIERKMYYRMIGAGLRPRCQYPVESCRIDFAFPEERVAVEVDGSRWHKDREKDQTRDRKLEEMGWKVIHITGSDTVRKRARTVLGPVFRALGRTFMREPVYRGRHPGRWDEHYSIASYQNTKK